MAASLVFDDEHMTVGIAESDASNGVLKLAIAEKHEGVGFYWINVEFESGNSTRIAYNGANSGRDKHLIVRTPKRNDTVKEIKVDRVRD
jgi:hypothetical protein